MNFPFFDLLPVGVCNFSAVENCLIDCRAKQRLPENSKSIIVYLFPYYLGEAAYSHINISKYAVSRDYHEIAGEYLEKSVAELKNSYPDFQFTWFCDNSPIPEVKAASLCGLGVVGENGLLINEKYGSFCFIGEIVTDMPVDCPICEEKRCIQCGLCKKHCFGRALSDGGFLKDNCFSHLTQKKGELSENTAKYIKNQGIIWGCDGCQDICPMNKNVSITPVEEFHSSAKSLYESGDILEHRAYSWRGRDVIERNLKIMCCNDEKNKL